MSQKSKKILPANKGTGAGGAKTTLFGKDFEKITCIEDDLISIGFKKKVMNNTKHGYYLKKKINDMTVTYLTQSGMKTYFKSKYNIELYRNPDEAYIVEYDDKIFVKIIEKKEQRCAGSVETKLWASPSLKREYEIVLGDDFIVEYALVVNKYFTKKFESTEQKYINLKQILDEADIEVFHKTKKNYCKKLLKWIKKT